MGDDLPLLDTSVLMKLRSDVGDEAAAFLIESLKTEISTAGEKFAALAEAGDWDQLETQAHALKSATRSFGALRLGEVCLALEEAGRREAGGGAVAKLLKEFGKLSSLTLRQFTDAAHTADVQLQERSLGC